MPVELKEAREAGFADHIIKLLGIGVPMAAVSRLLGG
jgi:hypothetical protein